MGPPHRPQPPRRSPAAPATAGQDRWKTCVGLPPWVGFSNRAYLRGLGSRVRLKPWAHADP
eukprot:7534289-Lingulodinium_polyedra.AAC.1